MPEEDADEEVDLHEGMAVSNEDGAKLGTLGALLVADDEEEAEFLLLRANNADHLVPFEAVLGVGDGDLILDVPEAAVQKFPKIRTDADPTDDEMELAYKVFDENAEYEPDE